MKRRRKKKRMQISFTISEIPEPAQFSLHVYRLGANIYSKVFVCVCVCVSATAKGGIIMVIKATEIAKETTRKQH